MVAFNFKKEFVSKIKTGVKTQTIRQKQRCKPLDKMQIYTGQRTKECKKIGEYQCMFVWKIGIMKEEIKGKTRKIIQITKPKNGHFSQYIEGITDKDCENIESFAVLDGFDDSDSLFDFFEKTYGLPFIGYLHKWMWTKEGTTK